MPSSPPRTRASTSGRFLPDRVKTLASKGGRPQLDYRLTRLAAYLVAMNGDPNKAEVAAAQLYFAVRTREAETAQPQMRALPQDYEKALLALVDAERARKRELKAREAAQAYARELEPKADGWDRFHLRRRHLLRRHSRKNARHEPKQTLYGATQCGHSYFQRSNAKYALLKIHAAFRCEGDNLHPLQR